MEAQTLFIIACFFVIALVYASVGFGGGSSYLALLAVMGVSMDVMRPAALLCNIVVVTGGTWIFYKDKILDVRKSLPFVLASVPLSFLGGFWKIEAAAFFVILGITLFLAGVVLFFQPSEITEKKSDNLALNIALGGGIGFLSGLVSIGGGIFLSPILNILKWDDSKRIAALASFFILVNSISGLAGQFARSATIDLPFILPLLAAVLVGGQIGSRLGARKFNALYVKRITGALIIFAAINILKDHLG